ncbi:MAG: hypothetical protein ACI4Q3_07490 [Kiritimatiellia bacterium]
MSYKSRKESLAKKYLKTVAGIFSADGRLYAREVEMEMPLGRFLPADLAVRHDFTAELESKVGLSVSDSALAACQSVGDLCRVLADLKMAASGRLKPYAIAYRAGETLKEEIVWAPNHEEAVAAVMARGAVKIVGIDSADDSDDGMRVVSHLTFFKRCLLPTLAAGLVAGGVILFFLWRRGLLQKFFE